MLMAGAFQWVTPSFLNSSAILNLPVHSSPASQVSPVATSIFEPFIAQPSLTIIVATAAGDGERESVPAFLHNPWMIVRSKSCILWRCILRVSNRCGSFLVLKCGVLAVPYPPPLRVSCLTAPLSGSLWLWSWVACATSTSKLAVHLMERAASVLSSVVATPPTVLSLLDVCLMLGHVRTPLAQPVQATLLTAFVWAAFRQAVTYGSRHLASRRSCAYRRHRAGAHLRRTVALLHAISAPIGVATAWHLWLLVATATPAATAAATCWTTAVELAADLLFAARRVLHPLYPPHDVICFVMSLGGPRARDAGLLGKPSSSAFQ